MALRDDLLPTVDAIRAIPGLLGLRRHAVNSVVETWSGARPGVGTMTSTSTPILNAGQSPKVTLLSQRDIVASGGLYQDGDIRVGPITPEFGGGGAAESVLDPALSGQNEQSYFTVSGPLITGGGRWRRVGHDFSRNFGVSLVLRREATNG